MAKQNEFYGRRIVSLIGKVVIKNESYSVRDNGTVLRHPREGESAQNLDATWTFGKKNARSGYLEIGKVRVSNIVMIAF